MKQVMYCEEKVNGIVPDGIASMAIGKVNWWERENIWKDAPEFLPLFDEKFDEGKLGHLKAVLKAKLLTKGFVFFDATYYRYSLRGDKLKRIGINYHFIQ